jgi:hypothetical protein
MNTRRGFTLIELLIIIAIIILLAAVLVSRWNQRDDPTETLKVNEWQCLKTEERSYAYPMLVGKLTVMNTGRRNECVEWKRRAV